MNLTVAVKIIGGFTIISLLLIVISTISLSNLSTISESTQQQNTLAIPTLKGSNKLALELSQMNSLSLNVYYQPDLSLLAAELKEYKATQKRFTNKLSWPTEAPNIQLIAWGELGFKALTLYCQYIDGTVVELIKYLFQTN